MSGTNGTTIDPMRAAEQAEAGARLAVAQFQIAAVGKATAMVNGYKSENYARQGGGRTVYPGPSRTSLNQRARTTQIGRVQDLGRNNTLARMMIRRLSECVAGDGYTFQARSKNQEWNEKAEAIINEEMDRLQLWQISQQSIAAGLTDGDILFVKLQSGELQAVEAQQIISPGTMDRGDIGTIVTGENGNLIYDGVEIDKTTGRIAAFWIGEWKDVATAKKNVPRTGVGQTAPISGAFGVLADPTRVPAEECIYLRWPLWARANQFRGEPGFQASINRFRLIDDYLDNVAIAAQMATFFGLIFKTETPNAQKAAFEATLGAAVGMAQTVDDGTPKEVGLEPGFDFHCKPGESVEQVQPLFPNVNTRDFVMMNIQIIGSEIGLPMMLSVFDFQGLTASNAKTQVSIAWATTIGTLQKWQTETLVRNVILWRLAAAIRAGRLPMVEDWNARHEISGPAAPVTDLLAEVNARLAAINGNLTTKEHSSQVMGFGDWDKIAERRAIEVKNEDDKKISPVLLPGAKTSSADAPKEEAPAEPAKTK